MNFGTKDTNENPQNAANEQPDISAKALVEITPPLPTSPVTASADTGAGETKVSQGKSEGKLAQSSEPGNNESVTSVPGGVATKQHYRDTKEAANKEASREWNGKLPQDGTNEGGKSYVQKLDATKSTSFDKKEDHQFKQLEEVSTSAGKEVRNDYSEQTRIVEKKLAYGNDRSKEVSSEVVAKAIQDKIEQKNSVNSYGVIKEQMRDQAPKWSDRSGSNDYYANRPAPNVQQIENIGRVQGAELYKAAEYNKKMLESSTSAVSPIVNRLDPDGSTGGFKEAYGKSGAIKDSGITEFTSKIERSTDAPAKVWQAQSEVERSNKFLYQGAAITNGFNNNPEVYRQIKDQITGGTNANPLPSRETYKPMDHPDGPVHTTGPIADFKSGKEDGISRFRDTGVNTMPGPAIDSSYMRGVKEPLVNFESRLSPGDGKIVEKPGPADRYTQGEIGRGLQEGRAPGDLGRPGDGKPYFEQARLTGDPGKISGDGKPYFEQTRLTGDPGKISGDGKPSIEQTRLTGDPSKIPGDTPRANPAYNPSEGKLTEQKLVDADRHPSSPGDRAPSDRSQPADQGRQPAVERPQLVERDIQPRLVPVPPELYNRPISEAPRREVPNPEVTEKRTVAPPQAPDLRETSPAPDKQGAKPERRDEDAGVRPRYAVGPGTVPVESTADARLTALPPVTRLNFDRTAGPSGEPIAGLPPRGVPTVDMPRTDSKPSAAPDILNGRISVDGGIVKAVVPTASDTDRRVNSTTPTTPAEIAGVRQPQPGRTTSDSADVRIVKPDASQIGPQGRAGDSPVRVDATVAPRPVGQDVTITPGVKVDAAQPGARPAVDSVSGKVDAAQAGTRPIVDGVRDTASGHGSRNVDGVAPVRLPGDVAGQRTVDGLPGRSPVRLPGIDDLDVPGGRTSRNTMIPNLVLPPGARSLTDKLQGEHGSGKELSAPLSDKLSAGPKRYMTGVEIALAAVIASGGLRKLRGKGRPDDSSAVEGDETQEVPSTYEASAASLTAEQWFSMSMMRKLGAGGADEMQKNKSDQVLKRPTYLIGKQETLTGIAENLFEDADIGWLIADVNAGSIKESTVNGKRVVELQDRQQIDLPVWQDIIDFYEGRPAEAVAENIITVVTESNVNSELVDLLLGPLVGSVNREPLIASPAGKGNAASEVMAAVHMTGTVTGREPGVRPAIGHLGQQLAEIAETISNPFKNQWPKPPATHAADLQAHEHSA